MDLHFGNVAMLPDDPHERRHGTAPRRLLAVLAGVRHTSVYGRCST